MVRLEVQWVGVLIRIGVKYKPALINYKIRVGKFMINIMIVCKDDIVKLLKNSILQVQKIFKKHLYLKLKIKLLVCMQKYDYERYC